MYKTQPEQIAELMEEADRLRAENIAIQNDKSDLLIERADLHAHVAELEKFARCLLTCRAILTLDNEPCDCGYRYIAQRTRRRGNERKCR
jgi:hypothetical protein